MSKPIVYVDLGGLSRPVRFGMNALADFSERAGLPLAAMQGISEQTLNLRQLIILVWSGLKDGARKEKKRFDAGIEDVGDWLDDAPDDVLEKVLSAFASAQGKPEAAPGKKKGATKKAA